MSDQLRDLHRWRDSDAFTSEQRLCLEYAEAASRTPLEVTDEMSAALTIPGRPMYCSSIEPTL